MVLGLASGFIDMNIMHICIDVSMTGCHKVPKFIYPSLTIVWISVKLYMDTVVPSLVVHVFHGVMGLCFCYCFHYMSGICVIKRVILLSDNKIMCRVVVSNSKRSESLLNHIFRK